MPIHNEEKSLNSSVGALFLSLIPTEVGMVTYFILNGCSDNSELVIRDQLSTIGDITTKTISNEDYEIFQDHGPEREYLEARIGENVYKVFQTETSGKANALKLGSALACTHNHEILISLDANNYVEPDTLALMYKEAYLHFISRDDKTVVLSAIPKKVHRETLGTVEKLLREHGVYDDASYVPVYGWCMALRAPWALKNIQPVAVEDCALGTMARSQNLEVGVVEEARVWGYRTNFIDSLNQFKRSVRGRLQLLNLHPELRPTIESDNYFMQPFPKRLSTIIHHISSDPKRIIKYIWRFIYGETGLLLGKIDYKKEPINQSWKDLSSTK